MWHVDEQFLVKPPIITITHAIRLPIYGGDTSFISLHAAYEGLSVRMQQYLEDRDGHQIQQPEIQANHRHQIQQRDPAERYGLA